MITYVTIEMLAPLLFLMTDIFSFCFFEQPIVASLLCCYSIQLLKSFNPLMLIVISFGLLIESSLFYGSLTPTLLYLIPLTCAGLAIENIFYLTRNQRYGILIVTLLIQACIIEPYFFQTEISVAYTLAKVFATLGIIMIFPLKSYVVNKTIAYK